LQLITPRQLHAEVMRTNIEIKTIAELDAELQRQGLPKTAEIFPLSFASSADDEPVEAEVVAEEEAAKKL
jgi:phage gp37-like protein